MSGLSLAHEPVTGISHGKLGMWVFLASEIMFFTGFFGAFIVLREANIDLFTHSAKELNMWLALTNTVILIGSSLTMALSIYSLERGNTKHFRLFLLISILCGFGFLIVKTIEYSTKFGHHIYPSTNIFFAFYFLLTGFHAIHVIGGIVPMMSMYARSFTKKGFHNVNRLETLGLYWHFVDLVWIFLFPVLYLMFPSH
ncbi:MAG: cytochrome c oxidase subunit 3 [Bacteroidota bacterium]